MLYLGEDLVVEGKCVPKSAYRATPMVVSGYLYTNDATTGTVVNSSEWFAWLELGQTFYYQAVIGAFTVRCEPRGNGRFWYGFRKRQGKLRKVYLGPGRALSRERLEQAAMDLAHA